MSDPLREGAGQMLDGLRREGIARILLATGDRANVAERVTEGLGLDGLRAGLTPDQKVLLVLSERKHGPVMMVGDGVNDGLVSTASLVVGVAAAGSGKPEVLIAGPAGLVAGAMSMAAGECVSVSSQTDAEQGDLARETRELAETPEAEIEELARIYVDRGWSAFLRLGGVAIIELLVGGSWM